MVNSILLVWSIWFVCYVFQTLSSHIKALYEEQAKNMILNDMGWVNDDSCRFCSYFLSLFTYNLPYLLSVHILLNTFLVIHFFRQSVKKTRKRYCLRMAYCLQWCFLIPKRFFFLPSIRTEKSFPLKWFSQTHSETLLHSSIVLWFIFIVSIYTN